ncbi:hypothetical protein CEXT_306201 [Caerostris extrusa]|uniref:Uncharacterized protein n=1 Tax=Caerostris extrusa TaxID=172846 RepID=A0AAV4T980_CAEEX|nr:hypothetical protein CEXT_306201 [Caerostris extrusa]
MNAGTFYINPHLLTGIKHLVRDTNAEIKPLSPLPLNLPMTRLPNPMSWWEDSINSHPPLPEIIGGENNERTTPQHISGVFLAEDHVIPSSVEGENGVISFQHFPHSC